LRGIQSHFNIFYAEIFQTEYEIDRLRICRCQTFDGTCDRIIVFSGWIYKPFINTKLDCEFGSNWV